jgi:hypothetical protein
MRRQANGLDYFPWMALFLRMPRRRYILTQRRHPRRATLHLKRLVLLSSEATATMSGGILQCRQRRRQLQPLLQANRRGHGLPLVSKKEGRIATALTMPRDWRRANLLPSPTGGLVADALYHSWLASTSAMPRCSVKVQGSSLGRVVIMSICSLRQSADVTR